MSSSESRKPDRRSFLKIVGGTLAGLVVGSAAGYYLRSPEIREVIRTVTQTEAARTVTQTVTAPATTVTQTITAPSTVMQTTTVTQTATVTITQTATPVARPRLTVAQGVDPTTMDPDMQSETPTFVVLFHVYDSFLEVDREGKLVPKLATSWTYQDPRTLDLELKRGVKFSNGEEFNAEVAAFNIRRMTTPPLIPNAKPTVLARDYLTVQDVEVLDSYRIRIKMKQSDPLLLRILRNKLVIPKKYVEENGFDILATKPVGTGPYTLKEWIKGDHLTLVKKADYWGGPAAIDEVVFRPIPEAATRVAELRVGNVDIITNVPPDQAGALDAEPNIDIRTVPSVRVAFVMMNTETNEKLRDPRIRQALNYAVDVNSIIQHIFQGYAKRISTLCPSFFAPYDPNTKFYEYNPAKAKQLLADAGYKDGFEIEMEVARGRWLGAEAAAEAIAGMLNAVGIKTTLYTPEFGVWAKGTQEHKIRSLAYAAWGNNTFNVLQSINSLLHSNRPFSWYSNAKLDALIDQAFDTPDPEKHNAILRQALDLIFEEAPYIFLYQHVDIYGVNSKVVWQPRPDELILGYEAR
jgi:peptide/nickel transport system substrate-binding protein